jgi:hypothetical protein
MICPIYTIVKQGKDFQINDKRFYMPGASIQMPCPECHVLKKHDFCEHYLSYPIANISPETVGRSGNLVHLQCEECDHEWEIEVAVNVSIDVVIP